MYGVLPFSIAFLVVFNHLAGFMTREKLFNAIIFGFLAYLALFAFVLYPNHQTLHLHALADAWGPHVPPGLTGAVGMLRNWTFTVFYCVSEMWGDVGLSLLFWGLANETTSMEHAPILYPLFGIGANIAQVRSPFASWCTWPAFMVYCLYCQTRKNKQYTSSRCAASLVQSRAVIVLSPGIVTL